MWSIKIVNINNLLITYLECSKSLPLSDFYQSYELEEWSGLLSSTIVHWQFGMHKNYFKGLELGSPKTRLSHLNQNSINFVKFVQTPTSRGLVDNSDAKFPSLPTTNHQPPPHPPSSLANASWGWVYSQLPPPPSSSLANTSRGWDFPHPMGRGWRWRDRPQMTVLFFFRWFFLYWLMFSVLFVFWQHDEGLGGWRRRERAQTTRFVSFGPSVHVSFFFAIFLYWLMFSGSICVLTAWRGFGWVAAARTSPNDAFCVVWAVGTFFFILFAFFN